MSRLFKRRWFQVVAGSVVTVAIALLLICWQLHIWSFMDYVAYVGMSRECHPVWKDLNAGRIWKGQSVDEVIRQAQPTEISRFGKYVVLEYDKHPEADGLRFTNLFVVAENDRAIAALAGSCTWERRFFDGWTEAEWHSFNKAWSADINLRWKQRQVAGDEQLY